MTARTDLLAIQRSWLARLERELRGDLVREAPAIRRYGDEYRREFGGPVAASTRDELIDAVVLSDVVYVGDYHTLEPAQRTFAWLVEATLARRGTARIALEMLEPCDQPVVDAFLSGELGERAFLDHIDYEGRWGFPWEQYRPIFELARRARLAVHGIDRAPARERATLALRDRFAASVIAPLLLERREGPLLVLMGDLHVARQHLPARVDARIAALGGAPPRRAIVYQNADALYWKLVRLRREQTAEVVRLDRERFCVFSAAPLAKMRSYLDWARRRGEAERLLPSAGSRLDPEEEDQELIEQAFLLVGAFFGVDPDSGGGASPDNRAERILEHVPVRSGLGARTPLDVAAAHATARLAPRSRARGTDRFYVRALREALGFVGARVANHAGAHRSDDDFRWYLARHRGRRLSRAAAQARAVARLLLRHAAAEARWLATGKLPRPRGLPRGATAEALARALGERLGALLYRGLIEGRTTRARLRDLLLARLDRPGEARLAYFRLVDELQGVGERLAARPVAVERRMAPEVA